MSKDLTEILGNEEPTVELEIPKVPDTKPMLEMILARMNEGFTEMREGFAVVNSRLDTVEKDIKEIKRNQRVFNNQLLAIEGRLTDLEDERKAS
jgi:hypothetical protein